MKNTNSFGLLLQFLGTKIASLGRVYVGERQQSARPQFHHKTLSDTHKTAEDFSYFDLFKRVSVASTTFKSVWVKSFRIREPQTRAERLIHQPVTADSSLLLSIQEPPPCSSWERLAEVAAEVKGHRLD